MSERDAAWRQRSRKMMRAWGLLAPAVFAWATYFLIETVAYRNWFALFLVACLYVEAVFVAYLAYDAWLDS